MNTNPRADDGGNNGFLIGLITGGVIGAGLVIAFAPRLASDLRKRVKAGATDLSDAASDGYQEVGARITGVVDGVTARAHAIRDDVADAVGRGAREVEQFAMASKTKHTTNDRAPRASRGNM